MRLPGKHFARNLIERRNLLLQLVRRDFAQRFVGSAAGWLWSVVQPLVLLLSWVFVFQICFRIPPPPDTDNYSIFLFCGMLPWMLFQDTVQRSATSMIEHQGLITKTVFPAEVLPVSIFLSSLINHLIALVLAFGAVSFWVKVPTWKVVFLPIYTLVLALFAIGLAWVVSSLHVYIRDTAQVVSVLLTFWFWFTPIFMWEEKIPEQFRFLLAFNPLAYIVRAYRERLLSARLPDVKELAIVGLAAAAMFVAGGLFFRHLKRGFADVL